MISYWWLVGYAVFAEAVGHFIMRSRKRREYIRGLHEARNVVPTSEARAAIDALEVTTLKGWFK